MLLVKDSHWNDAMSSEDGVNEATAALKGMLGIGGDSTVSQIPKKENPSGGKGKKKRNKNKSSNSASRSGGKSSPVREPSRKSKKKGEKKPPQPPQKENFAWSAFQALPDASTLPLPAFTSPANSTKAVNEKVKNLDSDKLTQLFSAIDHGLPPRPTPIDITNAPRAEDLEAKVIAEAEKAAENASDRKNLEVNTKSIEQEDKNAISESGINLAAIAASPKTNEGKSGMHPPDSSASSLPPNPPFTSPNQSSFPPPPFHSPVHMQQQQQPPHTQNPYMQPNMGYITIQVQVPPGLGPDRTMVVTSPAGYPVQIVVPEGVPPGMIIPVHVPTAPLLQSPYGNYAQQPQQQMFNQYQQQQPNPPSQKKDMR